MKQKVSKKVFSWVLACALVLSFVFSISANLLMDPFQIFLRDLKQPSVFLGGRGKDRYQHAGVIRSYQPNSVIIGHSHAANFFPSEMEKKLGWENVYSLTLDGSTLYEQRRVLDSALRNSEVTNVLWLIGPYNFLHPADYTNPKMVFPEYLYDSSRLNDLKLFFTLPSQLYPYLSEKKLKRDNIVNDEVRDSTRIDYRDRSTEWISRSSGQFNQPVSIARMFLEKSKDRKRVLKKLSGTTPLNPEEFRGLESMSLKNSNIQSNLEENIEAIVRIHQDVNFSIILIPPFPRVYWQKMKAERPRGYQLRLSLILSAVNKLSHFGNVEIFGFGEECFTEDLRLYKDKRHFHSVINSYILSRISRNKNLLTSENIHQYLSDFDNKISNYKLLEDGHPKALNSSGNSKDGLSVKQAKSMLRSCLLN